MADSLRIACERLSGSGLLATTANIHGDFYLFLVDTGTNYSTLNTDLIQRLRLPRSIGLRPTPVAGAKVVDPPPGRYRIDYLTLSGQGRDFVITDLEITDSRHGEDLQADGVLGMSFFEKFDRVVLDLLLPSLELIWDTTSGS